MDYKETIIQLLSQKPGLKAREIAKHLGIEKEVVNSLLYGNLNDKVVQDKQYRWWLRGKEEINKSTKDTSIKPDTPLSKFARYYLDCLSYDDLGGISLFASSYYDLDYYEIEKIPQFEDEEINLFNDEGAKRLLNKIKKEINRLVLYLGYPSRLKFVKSQKWEGFKLEPVFLLPFQFDPQNRQANPELSDELPFINYKVLESLRTVDGGNVLDEAIQLSEELGLNVAIEELPEFDEIIYKLISVRSEWDWKETIDPYSLSDGKPLSEIKEQGIYNRAIILIGERSPYTRGLEVELKSFSELEISKYQNTALGNWLSGNSLESVIPEEKPLLEVLPLNSEQRQAVRQGLSNSLTVITGPPGTGKSQVVTSILINAAWQGKKVLFASKNNKAVDVVETRINSLGPRPILLRLGTNEYQSKVAEYLVSLLGATSTKDDEQNYNYHLNINLEIRKRIEKINENLSNVIKIRNSVDQLEQNIELIRKELGNELFKSFRGLEIDNLKSTINIFSEALIRASRIKQPLITRIFWRLVEKSRFNYLNEEIENIKEISKKIDISLPTHEPDDIAISVWYEFLNKLNSRLDQAIKIKTYFDQLKVLQSIESLEELSLKYYQIIKELADNSEELLNCWLRLQPNRLSREERNLLSEYSSIIKLIVSSNDKNQPISSQVFRRYYKIFPKITNILSCWAVTSLSVRGRIPFEPGFFDLVVIDEASQCDIASAIPLLYRAKQAVIIGDPNQLRHVSNLSPKRDQSLLVKHDLIQGCASWAYSIKSLFDLAASLCRSEDIIFLRDHHRSHRDIISFSNEYFYENRLRIATRYERLKLLDNKEPAIRWINIQGKVIRPTEGGAVNEIEANAVVKEIERLVLQQRYTGSIGVVSPFRAHANRIKELVFHNGELVKNIGNMNFLVDTVHRFQGDERDLMIFSPVVSDKINEGALIFLKNNPNLFNVAITRARAALLVIGDLQAAINSRIDYLSKFANYVYNLDSGSLIEQFQVSDFGPEYPPVAKPEKVSEWERIFYKAIYASGIHLIPQYDIEQYTLDFALFKDNSKLNIEIDGERYHRNWDGELCRRDQIRNQRLIELGWDIMRFWVYEVRDDMNNCISRVKGWIENK